METAQKLLLTLAVIGLVIGIPVTFSHAEPAPAWALTLPMGAVFWGLFLISLLWQKELAGFDEEERLRIESARRDQSPAPAPGNQRAEEIPQAAEVG